MATNVVVQRRSGQRTCFLRVSYDGLAPPRELYADLAMIGWKVPAFAPPPASAIDWSTPDPNTGESFTVLPWRVQSQIVEPPSGSGPRGAWTDAEEKVFLMTLDGVLARHGVDEQAELSGLPAPPDGATSPSAPAPQPAPVAEPPGTTHVAAGGTVVIRAEAASPNAAVRVGSILDGLGVEHTEGTATRRVPITFRGAVTEIEKEVLAVAVRADVARADAVIATLRDLGLEVVAKVRSAPDTATAATSAA